MCMHRANVNKCLVFFTFVNLSFVSTIRTAQPENLGGYRGKNFVPPLYLD